MNEQEKEIITVETEEQLKELYEQWAMTWEGLREQNFQEAIKLVGKDDTAKGYLVKGAVMNRICHLTGDNAYPENLSIFAVYPYKPILAMTVGARWMYDIIDNNARREGYHPFEAIDTEEDEEDA